MEVWYWFKNQFADNAFSTIFAAGITWLYARQQVWRLKKQLKALQKRRQGREVALILSCPVRIRQAVINQLPAGIEETDIYEVHRDKDLTPDEKDWMNFVAEIKQKIGEIHESGATRIYLFTRIPVVMAAFAGALLDNGPEVIVHHYFNGAYQQVGRLTRETVYHV